MKIKTEKGSLLNSLTAVSKAVPTHTTMPILLCVLVKADSEGITLMSNDMEMAISASVAGEVIESGAVALESKLFLEIVRKLPDDKISLEVDENFQTVIKCGKTKFNLAGRDGAEFPGMPEIDVDDDVTISQFTLKEVIRQTIFSVADNETNKVMAGELFEIDGDKLKVTSLDGHRISIRNVDLRESFQPVKVIVPGNVLEEIGKIISGDADADVMIEFSKLHIVFRFDDIIVVSRLIEGKYFDVSKMLGIQHTLNVKINRRSLIDTIDRASLLVRDGVKKPIIMDVKNNEMTLSCTSSLGNMHETIDVVQVGNDIKIGFNPALILGALKAIDDEEITLYMSNKAAPCVIKDADDSYLYLILPVQFGGE